jgi:hypothetical protein
MTNLMNEIKTSFLNQFPKGYCGIRETKGLSGDMISITIGLVGNINDVTSKIRENDPMLHKFLIFNENGILSAESVCGRLDINPIEKFYAMSGIKTGFRKTTGNPEKIAKMYAKWFSKLKTIVEENKENIYNADLYKA